MKERVQKPIFFLGFPRSGTTIIFEAFSVHEELAWFSNKLRKYPDFPVISFLSRITAISKFRGAKKQLVKQSWLQKYMPYPDECYTVWERCCGRNFLYDYLIGKHANGKQKARLKKIISEVMRFHGKGRFAAKITGPSRIEFLRSIFPDAFFVHIVRDPRAVVNSLVRVNFWARRGGHTQPWWQNGLIQEDIDTLSRFNNNPVALAALQWRRVIQVARTESTALRVGQYIEVKYEDFINNPSWYMSKIVNFCDLSISVKVHKYMERYSNFVNQNHKYKIGLSKNDQDIVNMITQKYRHIYGYE